jgi:transaldolase/glucose-6-phosphate isomerase
LGLGASARWSALAARGARPQRLLWASTGTKDARYSDVLYVEELIGPDTVNTVPPATLDAFRVRGRARASLLEDVATAQAQLDQLALLGIDLDATCDTLLDEGVKLFDTAFDKLLAAVAAAGK